MINEKEKQLMLSLCRWKDENFDRDLLEYASPKVLGHLFMNRMAGVAYGTLKKHGLLQSVNREFRASLEGAFEQSKQKNESFCSSVSMLASLLSPLPVRVAMLKGAYLCAHYPVGFRTSSDVDLLVMPQDVTAVGRVLTENGFRQGYIRNGEFVPATRKEIIESKMTRGETVPYIKEVGLPFLRFLEVDVNFSWDYRGGSDGILSKMLSRTCIKQANGSAIPTLFDEDFFIHLCAHLYKEATTLPWIEMKRDMTLYKYCDVYTLLCEMHDEELDAILARARELGMEKICAYAILEASELFAMENTLAVRLSEQLLADHPAFRLSVVSPKEGRTLRYRTQNAKDRFFLNDRVADLWEVCDDATA